MTENMLSMLLVFLGLMALLGTIAKVALAVIHRRRAVPPGASTSLEEIARQIATLQQTVDSTAIEVNDSAKPIGSRRSCWPGAPNRPMRVWSHPTTLAATSIRVVA